MTSESPTGSLGLSLGKTKSTTNVAEVFSPMQMTNVVDVVALDKETDRVVLSMIETRPWGDQGALLPEFLKKMHTYLSYVVDEDLARDHPAYAGKKVAIRLHSLYPLTKNEEDFIAAMRRRHLDPHDIAWVSGGLRTAARKP
jgi:hypothetical protein